MEAFFQTTKCQSLALRDRQTTVPDSEDWRGRHMVLQIHRILRLCLKPIGRMIS